MKRTLLAALPALVLVMVPAPLSASAADLLPSPDAQHLPSGLITRVTAAGTGSTHPAADSVLRLRYSVSTSEGKLLARVDAPKEVMLPVLKMIAGWREAALLMVEGERRRAWVPESLGAKGKVPPGGSLVIDTELLEIIPGPKTPDDVAAPPANAVLRRGGLAYIILREGTGTKHPTMRSQVRVHYSGWTTNGKLFDSSLDRGEAAEFPLTGVIPGWQDMLQQMVVGERVRVWVPERLAYRGEAGKPKGTLVFEIALLSAD